jgi:putative ABC transport system permease protein
VTATDTTKRSRGTTAMVRPALRDLEWRRMRFAVAIVGAGVLFGLTLAMTGISGGFNTEASRTVQGFHADTWVVGSGAAGPFLGSSIVPASRVTEVAGLPGVVSAVPVAFIRKDVITNGSPTDVNVFGVPAGSFAAPQVQAGRAPVTDDEVAVSTKLAGYNVGDPIVIAGHRFVVVGTVDNSTALAGVPNVFLTLPAAQAVAFGGAQIASAFAVKGSITTPLPAGLAQVPNKAGVDDLLRALKQARSSIYLTAVLAWIIAALIIGSVVYLSVIERLKDFAVFKAIGVSTTSLLTGLALQAVILSLIAALVGLVVGTLLGPHLGLPVSISWETYVLLPVVAVVFSLLAILFGLRRALSVDPASAFGGP